MMWVEWFFAILTITVALGLVVAIVALAVNVAFEQETWPRLIVVALIGCIAVAIVIASFAAIGSAAFGDWEPSPIGEEQR